MQIKLLLSLVSLILASLVQAQPLKGGENEIIFSLAINQRDLWPEDATIEAVPQKKRDSIVKEVLTEISKKMSIDYGVLELSDFKVRKV